MYIAGQKRLEAPNWVNKSPNLVLKHFLKNLIGGLDTSMPIPCTLLKMPLRSHFDTRDLNARDLFLFLLP